ncbi:MAG TPA: mercury methylation corrinoid protein HgcA [Methanomassiliicoccaceae archaeon]|nr:mercury methylation corrinoid protein HgcA [Methanomassiliicoccaceae archaeon]
MNEVMSTTSTLGPRERRDHLLARLGHRRMEHRVLPGLYRLGQPDRSSPVLVSANYTLSFDALRSSLRGIDAYILVLDTKGVNVWCAAGKGTFGTDELVERIRSTSLESHVDHRRLILPQLGAPGVSAHEVKQRTGFSVECGPVRAADLPDYLSSGATEEMRRVTFPLRDRAVLIPVELRNVAIEAVIAIVALFILGGLVPALIALMAVMAGAVLFPLLLPYLPTKDFTTKGMLLGIAASAPFAMYYLASEPGWTGLAYSAGTIMLMVSVVGFLALNFTGCTTYASRSGVRREIFRYVPALVIMAVVGVSVLAITIAIAALGWF